ncbi:MAG: hypothetical protein ACTHOF_12055 [Flavisolibacter sp.]
MCLKNLFLICVFAITLKTYAQSSPFGTSRYAQNALQQLAKQYFKYNVYELELADVVDTLLQDTEIKIDTTIAHTDTSRLYVRGYHTSFNPFQIPLDSVRTIIAEIFSKDPKTEKVVDTIFRLQTVGVAKSKNQLEDIKACFVKMHKQIKGDFNYFSYSKNKIKKQLTSESYTYYQLPYPQPLLNITWKTKSENETVIAITFEIHLLKTSS